MTVLAIVGLQWGDEGKGKVVDILSEFATIVIRYAGGNNAGHTIKVGEDKIVLGLLPSGVLRSSCKCVLGGGMVIDPFVFLEEVNKVNRLGIKAGSDRIFISNTAFTVLPIHKQVDAILDEKFGSDRIGTTKKGIGPAYQDKVGRRGIRLFELLESKEKVRDRVKKIHSFWEPLLINQKEKVVTVEETVEKLFQIKEEIRPYLKDTVGFLHEEIIKRNSILLEGAQGTLLDIDYGTYPFVTSSNASIAGVCCGTGIPPKAIDGVIGVAKAYLTRVGEGPFPTEAEPEISEKIRNIGGEYGSVTQRPRRCGWLDIPALRRSVRINGVDSLCLTKLDVLGGFEEIPVCIGYKVDGVFTEDFPVCNLERAVPVYERWPGWKEDISGVREMSDLPNNALKYIQNIELMAEIKITMVSVGPSRNETILIKNPFR